MPNQEIISIIGVGTIITETGTEGVLEEVSATMKLRAMMTVLPKNPTNNKKNGTTTPFKVKIKIKLPKMSLRKLRNMRAIMITKRARLMIRSIKIGGTTSVATRMAKRRSTTRTTTSLQRSLEILEKAVHNNTNERNRTTKKMLREGAV
jgi:hypothetical protein